MRGWSAACAMLFLCACDVAETDTGRPDSALEFPLPDRQFVKVDPSLYADEAVRDERGEASKVMELADISPGMTVADIGAGEGYYTVRLAEKVGDAGRVLAQDIDREVLDRLGDRVEREQLELFPQ